MSNTFVTDEKNLSTEHELPKCTYGIGFEVQVLENLEKSVDTQLFEHRNWVPHPIRYHTRTHTHTPLTNYRHSFVRARNSLPVTTEEAGAGGDERRGARPGAAEVVTPGNTRPGGGSASAGGMLPPGATEKPDGAVVAVGAPPNKLSNKSCFCA